MRNDLPVVIRVAIDQTEFNPDAIDTEVYCLNNTGKEFTLAVNGTSFTTVDEESGDSVSHGSPSGKHVLAPGAVEKIADVQGWEWDGHVGITITFSESGSNMQITRDYNLKNSTKNITIESLNLEGRLITGR